MLYFIGLGNPGSQYQETRHNIGFSFIDLLAKKYQVNLTSKFEGQYGLLHCHDTKVVLFKPMTYMNNSGDPVLAMKNFFKINLFDMIVFHDDMDLNTARLKVKKGGGDGGHNGLKDITLKCGRDYRRFRLGIGRPNNGASVSSYVLSPFYQNERERINEMLYFLVDNLQMIILQQDDRIMNSYSLSIKTTAKLAELSTKNYN